jgi:hypothetical protein
MKVATRTGYAPVAEATVPLFRNPRRFAVTAREKRALLRTAGPVYCAWPGERETHLKQVIKRRALVALAGTR